MRLMSFDSVEIGNLRAGLELRREYLRQQMKDFHASDFDVSFVGLRRDLYLVRAMIRRIDRLQRAALSDAAMPRSRRGAFRRVGRADALYGGERFLVIAAAAAVFVVVAVVLFACVAVRVGV